MLAKVMHHHNPSFCFITESSHKLSSGAYYLLPITYYQSMQLPIALFTYIEKVVGKNSYSKKSCFSVLELLRLCVFILLYS